MITAVHSLSEKSTGHLLFRLDIVAVEEIAVSDKEAVPSNNRMRPAWAPTLFWNLKRSDHIKCLRVCLNKCDFTVMIQKIKQPVRTT